MLDDVLPALSCPVCAGDLSRESGTVRCGAGHSYDIARAGYLNLLGGRGGPATGDSAEMVAARAAVLAAGHLDPVSRAIADHAAAVSSGPNALVLEIGAGTGHHLAAVVERLPGSVGLAVDVSKHALRRAARAHPRIGAVAADAWGTLPVRTGAASLVLDVFAPRNGAEWHRVLAPGGAAVVVTPTGEHLAELVGPLGLVAVDERKDERLATAMEPWFDPAHAEQVGFTMRLARPDVRALVAMGPSARHLTPAELDARVAALTEPVQVTGSVVVRRYRRRAVAEV